MPAKAKPLDIAAGDLREWSSICSPARQCSTFVVLRVTTRYGGVYPTQYATVLEGDRTREYRAWDVWIESKLLSRAAHA